MDAAGLNDEPDFLLGRLRRNPGDQAAWSSFVDRYGVRVYGWCRYWKLQEADARDVTQNVMLELARQMSEFEYRSGWQFSELAQNHCGIEHGATS